MDFKDLQELIEIFEKSGLTEIEVEEEGRRMRLQKQSLVAAPMMAAPVVPPAAPAAETVEEPGEPALAEGLVTIDSPMVGTFYLASAPGEAPFVKEGDQVSDGQTVCIVEAMKLMNEVASKVEGTVEKVLVENAQPVEFGQPLFAVRPL